MLLELVKNPALQESAEWKRELAAAISSREELCALLQLDQDMLPGEAQPEFRLRVPRGYVAKMQPGDHHDPLLLQVLPLAEENAHNGLLDPVADLDAMTTPGLLHKYHGRVLLITTGACAIHCRYCFRRNFPYSDAGLSTAHWQNALDYIRAHGEIKEVILSGGDPLVLDDHKLDALQKELSEIHHVQWLRIHTRLPVVLPSRINTDLIDWIQRSRFRITMVIHANHGNEIGAQEQKALVALRQAGVTLLYQSVLLHRVNDKAETLIELSHKLHDSGVIPYYLHLLDKTRGAMHFEVPQTNAVQLMAEMRASLPGFLVPRLVREQAGENSKTAIFSI
jgi:EF-P beta-lysylation protein EpmB